MAGAVGEQQEPVATRAASHRKSKRSSRRPLQPRRSTPARGPAREHHPELSSPWEVAGLAESWLSSQLHRTPAWLERLELVNGAEGAQQAARQLSSVSPDQLRLLSWGAAAAPSLPYWGKRTWDIAAALSMAGRARRPSDGDLFTPSPPTATTPPQAPSETRGHWTSNSSCQPAFGAGHETWASSQASSRGDCARGCGAPGTSTVLRRVASRGTVLRVQVRSAPETDGRRAHTEP